MATNPRLSIHWPAHCSKEGCAGCGASYRRFRLPEVPRKSPSRLHWAKRQITPHDGDREWYWSRRTLLYVLHYLKAQCFIEQHRFCGGGACQNEPARQAA